jgi:hypothetical protein
VASIPSEGLGDRFHEFAASEGHARLGVHRPRTPYGREFLRIPAYGQVVNEDPQRHASEWKTFWRPLAPSESLDGPVVRAVTRGGT